MKEFNYGVYSIKHKGKLLYIGSSNDFNRRVKEHLKKLESGKHKKKLQKYVDENVRDLKDLEFELIHQTWDDSKIRLFFAEMICILHHKPICNNAVFQVGLKYISLGKPVVEFDKDILKYL
ncbi:GIY-YIG nuclease family protein [Acetivibrio cellulolyticus]|uniref:GIY-YIG nuclease family protein n=1 Tax=Acetivibrio cellulolyticus TaxID=35830 RepID=UPI0001E2BDC6|nr:GIY-YIG nuclease family protein [Acetivibrio cellulolyticus]